MSLWLVDLEKPLLWKLRFRIGFSVLRGHPPLIRFPADTTITGPIEIHNAFIAGEGIRVVSDTAIEARTGVL